MFNFTICWDIDIVAEWMTGIGSFDRMKINWQKRNELNSTKIFIDDEDKKEDLIVWEYWYMWTPERFHRCEIITTEKHIDDIPYFEMKEKATKRLQGMLGLLNHKQ